MLPSFREKGGKQPPFRQHSKAAMPLVLYGCVCTVFIIPNWGQNVNSKIAFV